MKYLEEFRNSDTAETLKRRIEAAGKELLATHPRICIMEVCGSHTMAIGRYGIRGLMPKNIDLISGPGCPVCVTDNGYIDAAISLAKKGVVICSFGDMLRVPGSESTLLEARAEGARVQICYSPNEALDAAQRNPGDHFVFLGIGFETTIAPVVNIIGRATEAKIKNISLLTAFKLIPPALEMLASAEDLQVDAFIGPAHVSTVIGVKAYEPIVAKFRLPIVIAGFEMLDVLYAIDGILRQLQAGEASVENQYNRVVKYEGNKKAQEVIEKYLMTLDAEWRGIGTIPSSGLGLKPEYANFDACSRHGIKVKPGKVNPRCKCGAVLKGVLKPEQCALFAKQCTPQHPVGACMVSSEGACAAYYRYWELRI
ncbi:MAG: hydrogenase formation protein HypD [SAR324 cluster bacterium]|uniref:Hydrogenase formation protein HypD n=1 Tax=SAR324 cluster bacterium TaxID=2024889 RepID=A0A7X9FSX9_9DELT|nr:hydrogenase formation protein HypD [SAR324 cluster bacterium]